MAEDKELKVFAKDLPKTFRVKYLGSHPAKGLYGMKHTRKPVDFLVSQAKKSQENNKILPMLDLEISLDGLKYTDVTSKKVKIEPVVFNVDTISYGVQDLIYTRVFTVIVLTSTAETIDPEVEIPFMCHSFLAPSRQDARQITYSLAAAFEEYGIKVKKHNLPVKKFAIDLRTPEEQGVDEDSETDA